MAAAVRHYGADEDILRGDPWVDYVLLEGPATGLDHDPDPEVDEDWETISPDGVWSMQLRRRLGRDGDPEGEVTVDIVTVADIDDPPAALADIDPDTPVLRLALTGDETKELTGSYYHDLSDEDGSTWLRGQFWLTEEVTQ